MRPLIIIFISFLYLPCAYAAADPACQPVIKASEARMAQPAWEQTSVVSPGGVTMKLAQVNGKSYRQEAGGTWVKSAVDYNESERQMNEQVNKGEVVLSNCSLAGEKTIDGVTTRIFHYTIKMPGAEAVQSTLYIGEADGRPYAAESEHVKVSYNYKNIKVE